HPEPVYHPEPKYHHAEPYHPDPYSAEHKYDIPEAPYYGKYPHPEHHYKPEPHVPAYAPEPYLKGEVKAFVDPYHHESSPKTYLAQASHDTPVYIPKSAKQAYKGIRNYEIHRK
ncbi:unnamed protein product, partial [Cyprideis torosa]